MLVGGIAVAALGASGCGSSSHRSTTGSGSGSAGSAASGGSASGGSGGGAGGSPSALSAEAQSAATGDIPDNQVFLTYHDSRSGYTIKYPEGWTQKIAGRTVTFSDKNNLVRIAVSGGSPPTPASVRAELQRARASNPTLTFQPPGPVHVTAGQAIKATYTTRSAPNQVTGKRVVLVVDRYDLAQGGRRAVIDLGTPRGVDNVDAYRMMINSFRWR